MSAPVMRGCGHAIWTRGRTGTGRCEESPMGSDASIEGWDGLGEDIRPLAEMDLGI